MNCPGSPNATVGLFFCSNILSSRSFRVHNSKSRRGGNGKNPPEPLDHRQVFKTPEKEAAVVDVSAVSAFQTALILSYARAFFIRARLARRLGLDDLQHGSLWRVQSQNYTSALDQVRDQLRGLRIAGLGLAWLGLAWLGLA
jgi:hypothetical protein